MSIWSAPIRCTSRNGACSCAARSCRKARDCGWRPKSVNSGDAGAARGILRQTVSAAGRDVLNLPPLAFALAAGERRTLEQEGLLRAPRLWSIETPHLYRLRSELDVGRAHHGRLRHPLRRPHHRLRRAARLPPQRQAGQAARHVQSSGPCRGRRGHPRRAPPLAHRATAGDGLERLAQRAQSAAAALLDACDEHGHAGDRRARGVNSTADDGDGRARAAGAARPQPPVRHPVVARQRGAAPGHARAARASMPR